MNYECRHGFNEFECAFCYLEINDYYGYNPDYYNTAYNRYLCLTPDKKVYKRNYFVKSPDFTKYYNRVVIENRVKKLNSLW